MYLSENEEAMMQGKYGPGIRRCIDILVKFGHALGAEHLVNIASAHTMPKEPPQLLAEMTEGVEQIATFTTLHPFMSAFDPDRWNEMGIPDSFAENELPILRQRQQIYKRIGFYPTYTCLPMLVGNLPRKNECISWIGSCAQLFVNSLIGARTNRDGTVVNLAAAITGKAPYRGLFLDENRAAEVAVEVHGLDANSIHCTDLGAIGYAAGQKAKNRNIVVTGLPRELTTPEVLSLLAPLAASGSVSLCHIVGLTPEARTLEEAIGGKKPMEVIQIGKKEISDAKALFEVRSDIDMVVLGCPHCTLTELRKIARLVDGKAIAEHKRLWIGAPLPYIQLSEEMGLGEAIRRAGGVITSACMATIPEAPIPEGVRSIATNSFKAAHYISRLTKGRVRVSVREMEDCLSAVIN